MLVVSLCGLPGDWSGSEDLSGTVFSLAPLLTMPSPLRDFSSARRLLRAKFLMSSGG
jgi:hypothetical protein